MTTKNELSEAAVASVKTACELIKAKSLRNAITTNMAIGIADFAVNKRYLTPKQLDWLRTNCSYLKIDLPKLEDQSEAVTDAGVDSSPLPNSRAAQIIQIDKNLSTNTRAEIVNCFASMTMDLLTKRSVLLTVSLL